MPRIALFALAVCVLAVAAAVVSFVEGSFLGIVWVLIAGITSNMTWFYVRRAKAEKERAAGDGYDCVIPGTCGVPCQNR